MDWIDAEERLPDQEDQLDKDANYSTLVVICWSGNFEDEDIPDHYDLGFYDYTDEAWRLFYDPEVIVPVFWWHPMPGTEEQRKMKIYKFTNN